ncbi:flagellar basal body rod protein FlgB [Curvivirga sp.]|uniref:flagellar basal body rod protein FlgB n=1 Tax=Curvivirga sp. TaxID=2856848 RepID=UPI003B5CDB7F
MTIASSALGGMMKERLNWSVQRQSLIAENIANANTPEYAAKDLKALTFKETLSENKVGLKMTHEAHFNTPRGGVGEYDAKASKSGYEISPDGNRVVLEEQMMKMNRTNGMHATATNLLKKYNAMYRIALKGQ